MPLQHPAAILNRHFMVALAGIAVLIVLGRVLIQPELTRLSTIAPAINLAAQQRMFSQKLVKSALLLVHEADAQKRGPHRQELQETLELWSRRHDQLQSVMPANMVYDHSEAMAAAFVKLEPHFQAIRISAHGLIEQTTGDRSPTFEQLSPLLHQILEHEQPFLLQINQLIKLYENSISEHVLHLQRTSWTIAIAILATIGVVQLIVIRPATQLLEFQNQQDQDRYQAVVESINEGLLVLDAQRRIIFANPQFAHMAGQSPQQLTGLVAVTLFHGPIGILWPMTVRGDSVEDAAPCELELVRPDRQHRLCRVSPCRLKSKSVKDQGWVVIVMDITEQRFAEYRAKALGEQLAHADRLKSIGEVAAGLAHEINQPLGAIANYAEGSLARIASGECRVEELESPLRRMLSAALRAGGIIRRVRQFSQKRPHTLEQADLNQLVQDVTELFAAELQRRRINYQQRSAAEPVLLECDTLQVGQILTNLMQNAMQAQDSVPEEQRIIEIVTESIDQHSVRLTLSDRGPGLSETILAHLYESFSTTRQEGLGIGLSITRSLVEAHGGEISARNRPEGGAEFMVLLPRRPPGSALGLATTEVVEKTISPLY